MPLIDPYWRDDPQAPYATFLRIVDNYLDPEIYDVEGLRNDANGDAPVFATFKREFREVVTNPRVLPEGALSTASAYEDGTDEAFLVRLWHELYGDESPTVDPGSEP